MMPMRTPKKRRCLPTLGYLALSVLVSLGCKSAPPPPPPSGVVVLQVEPASASLLVDEQPVMSTPGAARRKLSLPAGAHRLEARASGYFPLYRDLQVIAAQEQPLTLTLRADPDAEPPDTSSVRPLGTLSPRLPEVP